MESAGILPVMDYAGGGRGCGYGDGCGFGGGGGIWAILLVAMMFGGRGFGGFGGHGGCDGGGTHCVESELGLINDNFNSKINGLDQQVNSRFNDTNAAINQTQTLAFERDILDKICDSMRQADQNTAQLAGEVGRIGFNQAIIAKDAEISALKCCCETNRNIDSVNFNAAKNTCEIIQAGNCNTQKILDKMCCNEMQELRDKINTLQIEGSNMRQNQFLVNELRPCPVPAYPSCSPWMQQDPRAFFGFAPANRLDFDDRRDCGRRDNCCC